jgi:hypothetical protein
MLNSRRVELIRTTGKTDWYYARTWRMSASAIRLARTGVTWPHHSTAPDRRPRMPGRRGDVAMLIPVPAPSVNLARLIAAMPAPTHFSAGEKP